MRQAGVLGQTIYNSIDCTEIDIRFSENSTHNETVAFVVAVVKQFGVFFLPLLFGFQLSDNKIVYRDFAVTALCLWRGDLHCHVLAAACSAFVDVQELFVVVYILPRQGEQFCFCQYKSKKNLLLIRKKHHCFHPVMLPANNLIQFMLFLLCRKCHPSSSLSPYVLVHK